MGTSSGAYELNHECAICRLCLRFKKYNIAITRTCS